MKMPTIFALCKILCVGIIGIVLALHPAAILRGALFPATQQATVVGQVVQQGQQITDLERRVNALEQANLAVQIASIQSQLSIDHQFLMGILLMMITLAAESVWRIASGRKKESTD